MILTTQGLAVHCHRADENERACALFVELADLKGARSDYDGAVLALSDAGATRMRLGDSQGARERLKQAIDLARDYGALDWLPQVYANYAATYHEIGQTESGLAWLEQAGKEAARRGEWPVLVKLSAIEVRWRDERGDAPETVRACWDRAVIAALNCRDLPRQLEVIQNRYAWLRDRLGADAALPALEELVTLLARRRKFLREYAGTLNELGNTLQKLERFDEATRPYQQAMKVLERVDDLPLRATVLNNQGELCRKTGQFAQAIRHYRQALDLIPDYDPEERLSTEHNLALAEAAAGESQAAAKRLERIRDFASKRKLWPAHAKAWLALGDIAWNAKRHGLALQRYGHAIRHSTRHGLDDLRLLAELNRALLLLDQDRPAEVVASLSPLQTQFHRTPYCVELHLALADAYGRCQQVDAALDALRQAQACDGQNDTQRATVYAALAHALLTNCDRPGAWKQMTQAMSMTCPPKQRAELLLEAAELAVVLDQDLKGGPTEHTQVVIDLVQAESHWDLPLRRRFWCGLGDAFWQIGKYGEASISFTKSMIEGIQAGDWAGHMADGTNLFQRLPQIGKERTGIEEEVRSWLNNQGLTKPAEISCLVWPFALVQQDGIDALEPNKIISLVLEIWKQNPVPKT